MGFQVKVILDSISPNGKRLTTVEMTYPRFIHAEFMTHRDRARNAASSRAIPWKRLKKSFRSKVHDESYGTVSAEHAESANPQLEDYEDNCMFKMIMTEPVIPLSFDGEQKGMQSASPIEDQEGAKKIWLEARDNAVKSADALAALGVHKSICNRLTEPFMWITVLCTATEWNNFFRLRCHPAAEKHFQKIAYMVKDALEHSRPIARMSGELHLPYLDEEEADEAEMAQRREIIHRVDYWRKVSVGRCARLSYLTHDGKRSPDEDVALAERLIRPPGDVDEEVMHASPFEHVAEASRDSAYRSGPFLGWKQYRKEFRNENLNG